MSPPRPSVAVALAALVLVSAGCRSGVTQGTADHARELLRSEAKTATTAGACLTLLDLTRGGAPPSRVIEGRCHRRRKADNDTYSITVSGPDGRTRELAAERHTDSWLLEPPASG